MQYVPPFASLKNAMRLQSVKGQLKVEMTYDELLDLLKRLLRAVPFDEEWYRTTYPDVDEAIRGGAYHSARQHFVEHGYFEGRRPFALAVDEQWYLTNYPDVGEGVRKGSIHSALDHFERHGYEEGRMPADV